MGMNEIETFGLAIEVVSMSCFKFLFQVDGRMGIVLARYGQDGLKSAVNLRVARGKKFHLMSAPAEPLAKKINYTLRSAIGFRRNGDVNARNLSDLHAEASINYSTKMKRLKSLEKLGTAYLDNGLSRP